MRHMRIKYFIMDVDGTLTDGGLYIGKNGEIMKKFNVKDGYAIHDLLPKMGIIPVVITGRESEIVSRRCQEIGITHVIQRCADKLSILREIMKREHITAEEVAYMGDDLNDYECMSAAGTAGCPNDAADAIKKIADYVAERKGGEGAVREFVEWIAKKQRKMECTAPYPTGEILTNKRRNNQNVSSVSAGESDTQKNS